MRQARADMYVRPNESDHKIYLFPREQDMAEPSQNALLKILEEPPAYGVFILLTENPEKLLPTVRSRCTQLALTGLSEGLLRQTLQQKYPDADSDTLCSAVTRSGGFLGQALALMEEGSQLPAQTTAFLSAYASRDSFGLVQVLVPMERYKRDKLIPVLEQWVACLEGALVFRSGQTGATEAERTLGAARSARELMDAYKEIQKTMQYAGGNVSVAALCGNLLWKLR